MFAYPRKVQYHETDKMGIVHHSNYIKWMEEARIAFLDSIGLPFQKVEEMGILSPVSGLSIDYKKPCAFGDKVTVELEIAGYDSVVMQFRYRVLKQTGELAATAASKHCFLAEGRLVSLKRIGSPVHDALQKAFDEAQKEA